MEVVGIIVLVRLAGNVKTEKVSPFFEFLGVLSYINDATLNY